MLTALKTTSLYVLDQDAALDFYVGTLGLEVTADVDLGFMRWLTVAVPGDPRNILLELPGGPAMADSTAEQLRELVTKGAAGGTLFFNTDDARGTHARLVEAGVDITSPPQEQPYGIDFGLRDPFGNAIRVAQLIEGPIEFTEADRERMQEETATMEAR